MTQTLKEKLEALPEPLQQEVEDFVDFLLRKHGAVQASFNFSWAGGLRELKEETTCVALQHSASEWRQMVLADTNIFLEILLDPEAAARCRAFLVEQAGRIILSDFSLHSVGVILLRQKRAELFQSFLADVLPNVKVAGLTSQAYDQVVSAHREFSLDFDDAYQVAIATTQGSRLATLDRDFKRVTGLEILFLDKSWCRASSCPDTRPGSSASCSTAEAATGEASEPRFRNFQTAYAASKNLVLVTELDYKTDFGTTVRPDGTFKNAVRQDVGYWESKDERDDLDAEIALKLGEGYPDSNILFDDTRQVMLIQDGQEVGRAPMDNLALLHALLEQFVGFVSGPFGRPSATFRTPCPTS